MKTKNGVTPEPGPVEAPRGRPDAPRLELRLRRLIGSPWVVLGAVLAVVLALSWQFIVDAARAVPALDTAWYQWRAEYLLVNDPGSLITIQGAQGALAGGYRVAEPVLAAQMRTVGGVGAATPTVVLSILFRVLAAAGMAVFAWRHRDRSWLLFYLTLAVIPALFLLQQFFGFLDNFYALALLAGALLLLDTMRESWMARLAIVALLFLAGLSHPTSLALFLLSIGAVAVYRAIRERSVAAAIRSEGWITVAGTVAVALTGALWVGGLWGPTSSFSEAAVPPPEDVTYFVNRSLNVLKGMYPWILVPVMVLGLGALLVTLIRRRERFSELTLGWTLPLAGLFGFLLGAAYPYFRFFNATLAPLVAVAVGFATIIGMAARIRRRPLHRIAPVVAGAMVAVILGFWWTSGVSAWNRKGTWLTPEVRAQMAAAGAYLEAEPEGRRALFVGDAQPETVVSYGKYKEYANGVYAGLHGDQIDDSFLFFGTAEDLMAGRPSTAPDPQYNDLAADTAAEVFPAMARHEGNMVVLMPMAFNEPSPNEEFAESCGDACVEVGRSGLYVLPDAAGTPLSETSLAAAERAASDAAAFAEDPPSPLANLGGTLLAILRLGLLFVLPGWLLFRRLPQRSWLEGAVLVPLLSIGAVTTAGVLLVAIVRQPFGGALGWASWGLAVAAGLVATMLPRRPPRPIKLAQDAAALFRKRDFTFLMGSQWLAQAADGLVGVALAKHIVFGGQAGFDAEAARTPEDALRIALLTFLPYMILSPFLGVLIDRWDRKRLLVGANAVRVGVLALVVVLGIEAIGDAALFGSFLLVLAGTRLLLAIKGAGLPTVLGERDLMQGNAISQAGSAIFQLGGAGVALVASGLLPTRLVVAAGVAAYAVAALSAAAIKRLGYAQKRVPLSQEMRRILRDLWEGIREVGRRPLAALSLASFLGLRALVTFVVLSVGFASREFIAEEGTLTTAIPAAVGALGAAVGFVLAHLLKERVPPVRVVVGAMLLGGLGVAAFGGVITLAGISLVAFAVGLSFFLGKISVDTLMQQSLADAFRGRGFGLLDVVYNLSWILPSLVLWAAWTPGSARALLIGSGAAFLAAGLGIGAWARALSARGIVARPTAEPEPASGHSPGR